MSNSETPPLRGGFIERPKGLGSAAWNPTGAPWTEGHIWLGRDRAGQAIGCRDDRHLVTIAGSRAGKGVSSIIPNLALWPGSCLILDPKGENAQKTAAYRAQRPGHKVVVIDPFDVSGVSDELRGSFNPFDLLNPEDEASIDAAAAISEALVVPGDGKDVHWDESARQVIEGLILHLLTTETGDNIHPGRLRELLTRGDPDFAEGVANISGGTASDPFTALWDYMDAADAPLDAITGIIQGTAGTVRSMGENERGSVLSTARRNTKFLDSPAMVRAFSSSTFALDDLKTRDGGLSLYLCLPARFIATHARFLRIVLNLTLFRMETARVGSDGDLGRTATGFPVLFVMDEFASLGRMEAIEKAAGLMAGYGVKLWPILQDLSQIKRHYRESWESFLGNAGLLQFFGNTDLTTLEWLSKRIGETEVEIETGGTSEAEQVGSGTSDSTTSGTSRSKTSGSSEGRSSMAPLSAVSARDSGQGLMGFIGRSGASTVSTNEGSSAGETVGSSGGTTSGTSTSSSTTTTRSTSRTIHARPLARINELARYFDRDTGLQLVFVGGGEPLALKRTPYFRAEEPEFKALRDHLNQSDPA